MGKKTKDYDTRLWHNIQPPEFMDLSRKYEYNEDHINLLKKWLRLKENPKTVVEIGPGSGFFTEKLSEMSPNSKIIGVEPDDVLRNYIERKGIPNTRFLKGTAESILLPSGYSDLTVCHIVINNVSNVPKALTEMTRVTKRGGIVAAIEPSGGSISYLPDPELDELNDTADRAFGIGAWRPRFQTEDHIKPKKYRAMYPLFFHSCGLEKVEIHGILSVSLLNDSRRDQKETLAWLENYLSFFKGDEERVRVIMSRGGMEKPQIDEYLQKKKTYMQSLIDHPEGLVEAHQLEALGRFVTIGYKP